MNCLKEVQKRIEKEKVKFCNVRLSPEAWVNGNELFDIDDFMDFVHYQKIDMVFGCEIYDDADDYLITEEVIEEELGKYLAEEMRNIIEDVIREYNEKVCEIDFDIPSMYIVACLYEGQYFYMKKSVDRGIDESFIMEPNEKLQEIVLNNKRHIKIQRQVRKNTIENLKRELREIIMNDDKFLKCTNARLRISYIRELLANGLDEHFDPLRKFWLAETSKGLYQEPIDFVELLWREIKE